MSALWAMAKRRARVSTSSSGSSPDCCISVGTDVTLENVSVCDQSARPSSLPSKMWPSTMSDRLAPYLRYYSSHRPLDDHGVRPEVLIVFEDEIAQTHFLRVAREEMRTGGSPSPCGPPTRRR